MLVSPEPRDINDVFSSLSTSEYFVLIIGFARGMEMYLIWRWFLQVNR